MSFDLEVGRTRPEFEFLQRVVKGSQENFIHANFPGVPRKRIVCALVGHQVTGLQ